MPEENLKLPFHNLSERHRGVTSAIGENYTEAARICLDRHHNPPIDFYVKEEDYEITTIADWQPTDKRAKEAWNNDIDATEAGAYAFSLAAIELSKGLIAVRRAETKTGADYYISRPGGGQEDLEDCYRLEISGVDKGTHSAVQQRLRAKLEQVSLGTSNVPALASVVGFGAKIILIKELKNELV